MPSRRRLDYDSTSRARRAPRPRRSAGPARRGPPGCPRRRCPRHRAASLFRRQRPLRGLPCRRGGAGRSPELGPSSPAAQRRRRSSIACSPRSARSTRARSKSWPSGTAERRRECVKSLLAGELVDHSELGYDLDAHHLALMAKGEAVEELMGGLADKLDRRLLAVCREEGTIWACWLGGRRPLWTKQALRALGENLPGSAAGDRRRARRGTLRLAAQPPPGQGGAADRRAPRAVPPQLRRRRPAGSDRPR